MGLRDVAAKRQQQRPKGLRAKVQQRQTEQSNGSGPPPKGLAALRAAKQAQREAVRKGGLAALRKQRSGERKTNSKLDRTFDGLRYHNVRIVEEFPHPWGRISITNGDRTFTFHNHYGSWLADLGEGRLAEPAAVARALGTKATQLEVATILQDRWYAALKLHGIPTPEERIRQREEEARQTRRGGRGRKKTVDSEE
jgi:hypothetical protein